MPGDRAVVLGDQHARNTVGPEHVARELVAVEHDGVGLAFVLGQLADEREDLARDRPAARRESSSS